MSINSLKTIATAAVVAAAIGGGIIGAGISSEQASAGICGFKDPSSLPACATGFKAVNVSKQSYKCTKLIKFRCKKNMNIFGAKVKKAFGRFYRVSYICTYPVG